MEVKLYESSSTEQGNETNSLRITAVLHEIFMTKVGLKGDEIHF